MQSSLLKWDLYLSIMFFGNKYKDEQMYNSSEWIHLPLFFFFKSISTEWKWDTQSGGGERKERTAWIKGFEIAVYLAV